MLRIKQLAFTLIELLVVIAIIGILSGLIVVSMGGVTEKANIAKSQVFSNSLRNALMLNLVSEWKFDGPTSDGSSATSNDVLDTWSNINGSVPGDPYKPIVKTGSNCVNGSCLQFDGADDYIAFGNNSSLSMRTGDATISFWVNFSNTIAPQAETLIMCGAGDSGTGQGGYWIYRPSGTNHLNCGFSDGTAQYLNGQLSAEGVFGVNNWHNIVIVFTRSSVAQAYVNGIKQTGYSLTISSQSGSVQNARTFRVGSWDSTFSRFAGKMDEMRLYNAAMPTSQIKEQYYSGLNKLFATGSISKEEYLSKINRTAINE